MDRKEIIEYLKNKKYELNMNNPRYFTILIHQQYTTEKVKKMLHTLFSLAYKYYFNGHEQWFDKYYEKLPRFYGIIIDITKAKHTHIIFIVDADNSFENCLRNAIDDLKNTPSHKNIFRRIEAHLSKKNDDEINIAYLETLITQYSDTNQTYETVLFEEIFINYQNN